MKKVFMGMFAIATMLLATSCSEDELISQSSGNEVTVSFTANVRSDVKTKAVGDDTDGIDELIFAVYDENKNLLEELTQKVSEGDFTLSSVNEKGQRTATINVVLVKGQTYSFAFWAQNKAYTAYSFDPATKLVTVNYGQTANNKNADAFFANVNDLTVSGTFEKDVTLKRPFAQVNFLTTKTDLENAEKAGFVPSQSSIVVKNAATFLNVLEGTVSGSTEATFTLASLIEETETTTIKDAQGNEIKFEKDDEVTDFRYLATAYFLTTEGAAGTTIDASMNVVAEDNGKMDLSVPGVNAQRNFRTNIYGNLLTSGGKFNVTVDPGFDGDYSVEVEEETVTYDKLSDALNANKDNTEALTYNVESTGEQSNVTIIIPAGTNAASLTFSLDDLADNATISVSNATGGNYDKPVVIEVPEGVSLGALTVDVPNAHVTLKQGSYTTVESTTSSTTLEVGAGTTIETLTVNQGNVRIAEGGKVETITNKIEEGRLYVLMAGGEWTGIDSKEDNTIVIYEDIKHAFALNDMYSTDKIEDLISYAKDVFEENNITISLTKDVTGDVTIVQEPNVKITLLGNERKLNGMITVDGKSATYTTAGLIIKEVNFAAQSINGDACIRLGNGNNATRYTCNVTIDKCTFDVPDAVGVKSYTGGDKNLTITDCTATAQTHSLVQAKGIDDILVEKCFVYSKNGLNFNNSTNVTVDECTVDVKGYAVRFGESSGGVGAAEVYSIKNSALKSANEDGDAVIILRGTADYSTLTIENTTIEGDPQITNSATDAIIIIDGVATVSSAKGLANVVKKGITTINLADGKYDVYGCGGKTLTINGSKDAVIMLYNDGEDGCDYAFGANGTGVGNITFNGITINTTKNTGNYKGFAYMKGTFNDCNFVGAYSLNNANDFVFNNCTFDFKNGYFWTWGANSVKFDGCTFNGNTKNILAHGYASTAITINNCQFAATEKGFTGSGDNTACVEIDPAGTNTYTINFTGNNTKTEYYAGWTRIKDGSTGHTITGVQ